jgi:glutamyl-tRNA synthetase
MEQLRNRYTAPELIGLLAHLAGQQPQPTPVTPAALAQSFDWEKVPREDITVNL